MPVVLLQNHEPGILRAASANIPFLLPEFSVRGETSVLSIGAKLIPHQLNSSFVQRWRK